MTFLGVQKINPKKGGKKRASKIMWNQIDIFPLSYNSDVLSGVAATWQCRHASAASANKGGHGEQMRANEASSGVWHLCESLWLDSNGCHGFRMFPWKCCLPIKWMRERERAGEWRRIFAAGWQDSEMGGGGGGGETIDGGKQVSWSPWQRSR